MNMSLRGFLRNKSCKRDSALFGLVSHKGRDLSPREVRLVINAAVENGYETLYDIPDEFVDNLLTKNNPAHTCDAEQIKIAFE